MGTYNLRTVLSAFFVLQVAVTTVVVSYLARRNGQNAVNSLVTDLLWEILHRVEERLSILVSEAPRATHRRLGQANLRFGQDELPPSLTAAGSGRCQSGQSTLADQLPFKFRQGGENPKHQAAVRRRRVDVGPLSGQDFEADIVLGQALSRIDQMLQIAPQPVELPDHKGVPLPQRLEASGKGRTVVFLAGCLVVVDMVGIDASRHQGIALQVEYLAAVSFGDAGVSHEHEDVT